MFLLQRKRVGEMTVQNHVIDILLARYVGPAKQGEWFCGLAIYTMSFPSGRFFKAQNDLWATLRSYEAESGLFLFEVARGPAGSFDHLLDQCAKQFDNGLHRYLRWSDYEPCDTWYPPTETKRMVCDRGTFITLETLGTVVPGFPGLHGEYEAVGNSRNFGKEPTRVEQPPLAPEDPFGPI